MRSGSVWPAVWELKAQSPEQGVRSGLGLPVYSIGLGVTQGE